MNSTPLQRQKGGGGDPVPDAIKHNASWGLPSAGCPYEWTRFWADQFPRLHREWRAQNRVVVHCSRHTGFGNWVSGLPAALMYSLATEQALSLRCDDSYIMSVEANRVVRATALD